MLGWALTSHEEAKYAQFRWCIVLSAVRGCALCAEQLVERRLHIRGPARKTQRAPRALAVNATAAEWLLVCPESAWGLCLLKASVGALCSAFTSLAACAQVYTANTGNNASFAASMVRYQYGDVCFASPPPPPGVYAPPPLPFPKFPWQACGVTLLHSLRLGETRRTDCMYAAAARWSRRGATAWTHATFCCIGSVTSPFADHRHSFSCVWL